MAEEGIFLFFPFPSVSQRQREEGIKALQLLEKCFLGLIKMEKLIHQSLPAASKPSVTGGFMKQYICDVFRCLSPSELLCSFCSFGMRK